MNVEPVTSNMQLFLKLDAGRNDVVVTSRLEGLDIIKRHHLTSIHVHEKPLVTLNLYHYLNKKNKALLPDITKVLLEMETEGRIQAIRLQVITELLN